MKRFAFDAIHLLLLLIATPWIAYRRWRWGKHRRGWLQKFFGWVPKRNGSAACIWFHAVSVGEVNLLLPVIDRLKVSDPHLELVFSTTTETGFDVARRKFPDHIVFFWPFDFSWAIGNSLRRIRPDLIVLAELELWPNFIELAYHFRSASVPQGIPIAVINGRLSQSSFYGYQRISWLMRPIFAKLRYVAAQDPIYAERFVHLGCPSDRVVVTGNIKYDGVRSDRSNQPSVQCRKLANIQPTDFVFVAGSTQLEEDLIAAEVYRQMTPIFPHLRLILVPRHPERCTQLVSRLTAKGFQIVRRSQLGKDSTVTDSTTHSVWQTSLKRIQATVSTRPILIVDGVGELNAWWGLADVAFVGGSLGKRGGQNMIEPAAYAAAVCFGPNTHNFSQAVAELLAANGAVVVHNQTELQQFVHRAITDCGWARELGCNAQNVVLQHHGAAIKTVQRLLDLLKIAPENSGRVSNKPVDQ